MFIRSILLNFGTVHMSENPLYVASVGKALRVLDCFKQAERDLSLTEIVELSGFDKSAAQRYLHTLCAEKLLVQHSSTRRYRLNRRVLDYAFHFLRTEDIAEQLNPIMLELAVQTGEKISLSLLDGHELIHIMRHQTHTEHFHASLIGRRVPLYCTAGGRAVLATLDDAEARHLLTHIERLPYTPKTLTDIDAIMDAVSLNRDQQFGWVCDEFIAGEIGLAVAILDAQGRPLGALHLSGSSQTTTPQAYIAAFAPPLLHAVAQFHRRHRY
jgi:DNA-binding IclR family transcriptional regulator